MPRMTRVAWWMLFVVSPLTGLLFLALGTGWQQELRARLDMSPLQTYDIVRIVGVTVLTFVVILLISRLLRLATRALARLAGRFVPRPVAYGIGFVIVVYLVVGFVEDVLISTAVAVLVLGAAGDRRQAQRPAGAERTVTGARVVRQRQSGSIAAAVGVLLS